MNGFMSPSRPRPLSVLSSIFVAAAVAGGLVPAARAAETATTTQPAASASLENRPITLRPFVRSEKAPAKAQSFGQWWGRSLLALGAVLALIAGATWAVRKYMPAAAGGNVGRAIEMLGRYHLAPKQSLCLVRVGRRAVLVGVTPSHMTALLEVRDPEEVHVLSAKATKEPFSDSLRKEIDEFVAGADAPSQAPGVIDDAGESKSRVAPRDHASRMNAAIERFRMYARQKTQKA